MMIGVNVGDPARFNRDLSVMVIVTQLNRNFCEINDASYNK